MSKPVPSSSPSSRPAWRRGWTWTLLKCGATLLASALAGTAALFWLLRTLLDKLPGWIPGAWTRWVFEWVLRHLWFVGPLAGVALGLLVSVGIVAYDAKRGRLTRLP